MLRNYTVSGMATGAAKALIFLKALPACFTVSVTWRGAGRRRRRGARGSAFPRGPRVARGGEAAAAADARRRRRGFHRRGAADARRDARGLSRAARSKKCCGTPARTELEVVAHVARLGGAAALRLEGRGVGLEEGARRVGPAPFEERH